MRDKNARVCGAAPQRIFACSGAADVGAIADQAGFKTYEPLQLADLGVEEGETPPTP